MIGHKIDAKIFPGDFQRHRIVVDRPNLLRSQLNQGDRQYAGAGTNVEGAEFVTGEPVGDIFDKFHAAARGSVGARAESQSRFNRDDLPVAKFRRREPRRSYPKRLADARRFDETAPGLMPGFRTDRFPLRMWFRAAPGYIFKATEISLNRLLQCYLVARTAKVRFQAVALDDHAGRAALDEIISDRIDICR